MVEALRPNKSDALAYVDGDAAAPVQYAHAVLDFRATTEPYYQDIVVGPLPVDNTTTTWQPLEYTLTKKNSGKVRNLDADDLTLYSKWLYIVSASISDITLDLWNGTALGLDNDTLDIWESTPSGKMTVALSDGTPFGTYPRMTLMLRHCGFLGGIGETISWDADSTCRLPLGLYFKSDVTGRDPSKWKLEGWLYNGIFYETTDDFRKAYESPGFVKYGANEEGDWARSDQQGPILPMDASYPPTSVAPSGSRFSVDPEAKYVEWMDFSFYIGFTRDTGIALYDIRYKGERVIYELALQEALAHYAGT